MGWGTPDAELISPFCECPSVGNKIQLCMLIVFNELYPFIPLSVTLIVLEGHGSVEQSSLKILCSYSIRLKVCTIVEYIK